MSVKDYIHYSTYYEVRCPIGEDGRIGQPEVVRKFTNQWLGSKSNAIAKKSKSTPKTLTISKDIKVEEL
ncbi:MAG TPA: hypothetical protein V6C58_22565 [Allocoleopsis sp.]